MTHNLIGLNPNTAYQYRAYATTSAGTVYGTTQNFTTLAVVPPTVVTSPATAISQNIANLMAYNLAMVECGRKDVVLNHKHEHFALNQETVLNSFCLSTLIFSL